MVGPYQIQVAADREGGFHSLVASASKQGGLVEIDGLRSLRLLRSWRVRSKRRRADVVRFQSRITRFDSVRPRAGTPSVCGPGVQSQQWRRCTRTESHRRPIALDEV